MNIAVSKLSWRRFAVSECFQFLKFLCEASLLKYIPGAFCYLPRTRLEIGKRGVSFSGSAERFPRSDFF